MGWIKISGTKINYPVMKSSNEPNFYLKHDFNKNYTDYGCPYVQKNCDLNTAFDNIIIYGHNMKDGSMFSELENYKTKSYWESHKTIRFDTLTSQNEYEVICVFEIVVYTDDENSVKYYNFVNAENETQFNQYINKCHKLSLYSTGTSAKYDNKLITLSTCEHSQKNGRLVVVAKRIIIKCKFFINKVNLLHVLSNKLTFSPY